jgi:3-oxoacyl-[acyl-carrier-protein] synthase III
MSIGVKAIGTFIPHRRVDNRAKSEKHGTSVKFIEEKIGITSVSRKEENERASDLCVHAFQDLLEQGWITDPPAIDFICVCTQTGDYRIPHTSAIVHQKLGLPYGCANFDISLGCSGYVYSLPAAKGFMEVNGLKLGILFTADPYSEIIDPNDKNTDLLFGDAATATLLTPDFVMDMGRGVFGTVGASHRALIKPKGEPLCMNGRHIFEFAMRQVPANIADCLAQNNMSKDEVDLYILHQASKFVVDNIIEAMKLDKHKVPFLIQSYGNTVSSSIPIIIKQYLHDENYRNLLLCGFGVGLSVATMILKRRNL